jgi:hypothetical protein
MERRTWYRYTFSKHAQESMSTQKRLFSRGAEREMPRRVACVLLSYRLLRLRISPVKTFKQPKQPRCPMEKWTAARKQRDWVGDVSESNTACAVCNADVYLHVYACRRVRKKPLVHHHRVLGAPLFLQNNRTPIGFGCVCSRQKKQRSGGLT